MPDRKSALPFDFETIGKSVDRLPIRLLRQSGDRCRTLIFAGMHGEEPETTVAISRALRCLDSLPESCAVVPCLNPDGVTLGTRGNANGVDLNRNFPTEDWQAEPVKYRWHVVEPEMTIPILTGDAPGSEPETQVLIELVEKLQPDLVIALHGPLACIDDPEKSPEARWIAEETGLPVVGDVGYPTPGSFGTWCAERDLPVITWEFPAESVEQISQSQVPTLVKILSGEWPFG